MKNWYVKHSAAIEHWAIKTVNILFLVMTLYVLAMTCYAMLNLEKAGYPAVFRIHDEVIVEKPEGEGSLEEMVQIMTRVPDWAEGLPLNAAGFETHYYMKN